MSIAIVPSTSSQSKIDLSLLANEVHVWRMGLDVSPSYVQTLFRTLAPAERDRASRFRSPRDRSHFIVRRGVLREICSAYLAVEAALLAFEYGPWGKPCLSERLGCEDLRFSISHSGDLALYAITKGREVGVDIERVRCDMAWQSVAEVCLSAREAAVLSTLPPAAQARAFFMLWTRKEAYVKARGTGLSACLNEIDVLGRTHSGSLLDLDVGQHYVAALAVEALRLTVVSRRWTGTTETAGANCFDVEEAN